MQRIKIHVPQQDFVLKMQGGLMRKGRAYLQDTTVVLEGGADILLVHLLFTNSAFSPLLFLEIALLCSN